MKKIISFALVLIMLMSAFPVTSFAANALCGFVGHNVVWIETKAATCLSMGEETEKCSRVGCDYYSGNIRLIPVTTHELSKIAAVEPTCDKVGYSEGAYCPICELVVKKGVTIPSTGHKVDEWLVDVEATCTVKGRLSGFCFTCQKYVFEYIPELGHLVADSLSWSVIVSPTCTKEGKKVADCSRAGCSKQVEEIIPAIGHYETIYKSAVEPTCSKEGSTESKQCTVCKTITVKSEVIPKLGHKCGEWKETKTATCLVSGVAESICSVCKEKQIKTIDRLPHTEEVVEAKAPTCTEEGITRGVTCTVCKTVLEKVNVLAPLGHDYVIDKSKSWDATCESDGAIYGKCSRCGDIKDEVLPAKGHSEEIFPGTPADCTLSGVTEGKVCKVCGMITVEPQQTPALGHDFVMQPDKSKPATCTENGLEFLNCSRCKAVDIRETPATGHSYGDWKVTQEPTCDKQGIKTRTCVVCGSYDIWYTESLGAHDVVIQPAVEATCTTDGMTQGSYCDKCNEVFETQEIIPSLGHKIDGVEPTLTPATTKKEGSYAIACERCNELVNPQIIAKIDEKSIKLSTEKCTYNGNVRTPSVIVKDVNGKTLVKDVDYTVKYDSGRRNPGVYDIKVTFRGIYSGSKTLVFTIAPDKTTEITATSSQKDYVKLSWQEVSGATGYRVYAYETVEGNTRKKIASVTGTTYNLHEDYLGDSLAVGAQYKVAVTAYTKLEDDTVIHALAGTAKTFTRTPGKPSLTVTSASGKANLKWTNVEDETGYQVFYATSEDVEYKKLANTVKNEYSNTFANDDTLYFKVRAYTKVDDEVVYGSFSDVKSVTIVGNYEDESENNNNDNSGNTSAPDSECNCKCHGNFIQRIMFKITNFFKKIFGVNKVCRCGVKH